MWLIFALVQSLSEVKMKKYSVWAKEDSMTPKKNHTLITRREKSEKNKTKHCSNIVECWDYSIECIYDTRNHSYDKIGKIIFCLSWSSLSYCILDHRVGKIGGSFVTNILMMT